MPNYCSDLSLNVTTGRAQWVSPVKNSVDAVNTYFCETGFVWDTNNYTRTQANQTLRCVANSSANGLWLYEDELSYGWPTKGLLCKRKQSALLLAFCSVFSQF